MNVIAADIGGTKSLLAIVDTATGELLQQAHLMNREYLDFYSLLAEFIGSGKYSIDALCLALPASVLGEEVQLTNLHWVISSRQLKHKLKIDKVIFINDFQAAALGTTTIANEQLLALNAGAVDMDTTGIRVVTGAGTGLGVAFMVWQQNHYVACSSEAGHLSFAPMDDEQAALRDYLSDKYGHVSYERIVSGPGIEDSYRYFARHDPVPNELSAQWVNQQATAGNPTAQQVMTLFSRVFGAFAGNLAVAFKPFGGLYITGGVSAKTTSWLQGDKFRAAFEHKGRMSGLVNSTPVYLVNNEKVGLQGAVQFAMMEFD